MAGCLQVVGDQTAARHAAALESDRVPRAGVLMSCQAGVGLAMTNVTGVLSRVAAYGNHATGCGTSGQAGGSGCELFASRVALSAPVPQRAAASRLQGKFAGRAAAVRPTGNASPCGPGRRFANAA